MKNLVSMKKKVIIFDHIGEHYPKKLFGNYWEKCEEQIIDAWKNYDDWSPRRINFLTNSNKDIIYCNSRPNSYEDSPNYTSNRVQDVHKTVSYILEKIWTTNELILILHGSDFHLSNFNFINPLNKRYIKIEEINTKSYEFHHTEKDLFNIIVNWYIKEKDYLKRKILYKKIYEWKWEKLEITDKIEEKVWNIFKDNSGLANIIFQLFELFDR